MDKTIIRKATALMLAFILTFANVILLGIYTMDVLADGNEILENQNTNVSNANMTFDAYFLEGEAGNEVKKHSKSIDMATNSDTLYVEIKVTDGYLASGTVNLVNSNIELTKIQNLPESVQSINIKNKTITLNKIESGETVILALPIKLNTDYDFDIQNLDITSEVVLQGNYIDDTGVESSITKTSNVEAKMTADAEASLEVELTKYLNDTIDGHEVTILQFIIRSQLELGVLPIETTELEIEIPKINNVEPETVSVSAYTNATNGIGRRVLTPNQYSYENGKIELTITNEESNGIVTWHKDGLDEIMITCVYDENVTELEDITISANSKITPYTYENEITESVEVTIEHDEAEGLGLKDPISYELYEPAKIQKGYMLVEGPDNTPYDEQIVINIGSRKIVDKIVLSEITQYVEGNNEYRADPLYISTSVRKEDLVGILGEDGYINIYSSNGTLLTTLNKDNLKYEYEDDISLITIETSKPQSEGEIYILNKKEIEPLEYSKTQLESFTNMKAIINGKTILNDANVTSLEVTKNALIELENPTEQASLKLSTDNFSTVTLNESVELSATLKTTDASTVLYKNPTIEYILPNYIKDVKVTKASILYDNFLTISKIIIDKNNNNNIILRITMDGEQRFFNKEAIVEGATIILEGDFTVNELTPTRTENLVMNVTNAATNNTITENVPLNFIAPVGMATVNQISNINDIHGTVTSISGRSETGVIKPFASSRTAEVKMTLINNNQADCENIVLLGRIPFEGNKDIIEGEELGSTFTTNMTSAIQAKTEGLENHYTVYYSENGEATKDLNLAENGWTNNADDLSNIKSYMIVMNNYTLLEGDILSFSYNIELPENIEYSMSAFETYVVYYNKVDETQVIETSKAAPAGFTTGQGPNLEIEVKPNLVIDTEIEEGQINTYIVTIKNNNNTRQDGVVLNLELSKNVIYAMENGTVTQNGNIQNVSIPVGSIEANSETNIYFTLEMGEYTENAQSDENEVSIRAIAGVEGYNITFESEKIYNTIVKEEEKEIECISLNISNTNEGEFIKGNSVQYIISIRKEISETLYDVVVTCKIPEGLKFDNASLEGEYDENTNTITWSFDTLDESKFSTLTCIVEGLPNDVYKKEIPIGLSATCNGDGKEYLSNVINTEVYKEGFTLSQTSSITDGNIKTNDEVTYNITVQNISKKTVTCTIKEYIPKGLEFISFKYTQKGNVTQRDQNNGIVVELPLTLDAGEKITISVKFKVKDYSLLEDIITNRVILNSLEIDGLESIIENNKFGEYENPHQDDEENPDNPDNPGEENPESSTYSISGVVWVDNNKNGKRDTKEELKDGIEVLLLDSKTNEVISETQTDENGAYKFENISKKQYIVAFKYDTLEYEVTTYQAKDVKSSENSDAIRMLLKVNDKISTYAVTDTLYVSSNKNNIDLGLVINKKFDLELTKSIALIQTSNSNGTQTYTFDNQPIAKIEIPGKEIVGTVVAITYKFTIENKGAIEGYVNKIVDYIPADMSFTSSLNPEWYKDKDGNLYNVSLANRMIKPGEKIELSLVLNKTMTEENIGLVNNGAEIYEASNDYNTPDIDSTFGNKNITEDDYGSADVIVTVKTGQAFIYFGIMLVVIAIFGTGIYLIKKKVLIWTN